MCSEHVYAPPTAGELEQQPSPEDALSLSFPSCKMEWLRWPPRASASPTVYEGLDQTRGCGSNWTWQQKASHVRGVTAREREVKEREGGRTTVGREGLSY